jgi:hypothetical protein
MTAQASLGKLFQGLIEECRLGFLPVRTVEEPAPSWNDPALWHPRKGFEVGARNAIVPAIPLVLQLIEKHEEA